MNRIFVRSLGAPVRGGVPRAVLIALVAAVLLILGSLPAVAVHDEEFQMDGNTVDDAADDQDFDWQSFFSSAGAESPSLPDGSRAGFIDSGFKADHAATDHSSYAGGQSKDDLKIAGWKCKTKSWPASDLKFDLVNTYAVAYRPTSGPRAGHLIIYAAGERGDDSGDANFGIWFLRDQSVGCEAPGGGGNDTTAFTGAHTDGDVLVVAKLVNGGGTAELTAYEWVGNDATGFLDEDNPLGGGIDVNAKCGESDASLNDNLCAIANSSTINPYWAPNEDLLQPQFAEMAIDLTALGATGCFNTFLTNTRSSHTPDSTLHDFAVGTLNTCATLTIKKYIDRDMSGTNNTGDTTSGAPVSGWTYEVKKDGVTVAGCGSLTTGTTGTVTCPDLAPGTGYTITETQKDGYQNTDPGPIVTRDNVNPVIGPFTISGNTTKEFGNTCLVDVTFRVNNVPSSVTSVNARYSVDAADTPSTGDNPSDGDKSEPVDIALSVVETNTDGTKDWAGTESDFLTQKDQIDWGWYINGDTGTIVTGVNNLSLSANGFVTALSDCTRTSQVNFPNVTIHGFKYKDLNVNGDHDADVDGNAGNGLQPEPPLPGIQFKLFVDDNGDGAHQSGETTQVGSTVTSGSDGTYTFGTLNIAPGKYTVVEFVPAAMGSWVQTEPASGAARAVNVTLGDTDKTVGDFGNTPLSRVSVTFTSLAKLANGTTDATEATSISCVAPGAAGSSVGSTTTNSLTTDDVKLNQSTVVCTVTFIDP